MSLLRAARHRQQRREVRGLHLEVDVAAVAEAAEQIALRREHLGVREAGGDLLVDELVELVDARRVERPRADSAAARPQQEVVVLELRLLLALHVGLEPLRHHLDDLAVDRFDAGARRELEEAVDGVALHGRQVVQRRQQHPRENRRRDEQRGDGGVAARARVRPRARSCSPASPNGRPEPLCTLIVSSQREAATGSAVTATSSEATTAMEIVSARSAKSWLAASCMKTSGRNTMTAVTVDASSAGHTCFEPAIVASRGRHSLLALLRDGFEHDDGGVECLARRRTQGQPARSR